MTPERNVAQIIRLLHPSDSLWRTTSVLKGFFDDSGTHDGSLVLGIGGCVAREEQWNFFASDWQKMLEDFGIKEFKSSDLQVFTGEFKGWTEEKRRSLIGTAAKIGTKWAKDSFASLVVRSDYADAIPEWAKNTSAFGDDYNFCFQMTVGRIMAWINRLHVPMPANEQIAFVFDQQPKKEGISRNNYAAIKSLRDPHNRMGALAFVSSERFLPLQFADFIAYEAYKHLDALITQSGRKQRMSLTQLISNQFYLEMTYFDRGNLESLVQDYEQNGGTNKGSEPWWPWHRPDMLDSNYDANAKGQAAQ